MSKTINQYPFSGLDNNMLEKCINTDQVKSCMDLLSEITSQVFDTVSKEGLDDVRSYEYVQASLLKIVSNVAESKGYNILKQDLDEVMNQYV